MAEAKRANGDMLDVIVRHHVVERSAELSRCIFSIACQNYQPVTIWLCTQRFTAPQIAQLEATLAPVLAIARGVETRFLNFAAEAPIDARSVLLNLGIRRSSGRYLAFLDYDDVIYPEAYNLLIDELEASGCAIAFASITMKHADTGPDFVATTGKAARLRGANLRDLFTRNFCPIHSFVIDRSRVIVEDLFVDSSVTRAEDYDFLMRLCATYPASFRLYGKIVGDYYLKNDGSNTVLGPNSEPAAHDSWVLAEQFLAARRGIVPVSPAVQRSLGIAEPDPALTIQMLLESRS